MEEKKSFIDKYPYLPMITLMAVIFGAIYMLTKEKTA